jgi:hypothetical protein
MAQCSVKRSVNFTYRPTFVLLSSLNFLQSLRDYYLYWYNMLVVLHSFAPLRNTLT